MINYNIPVENLPSKGILYGFSNISISQLTYAKILDYKFDLEKQHNEVSLLITQLNHLIMDLPNGADISMYDAFALMAVRVYSSSSKDLSNQLSFDFECPIHHKIETVSVDIGSMKFEDMDPKLAEIETIKLNNERFRFRIPTVKEFIEVANSCKTLLPVKPYALKLIWLLSMFKDVSNKDERLKIIKSVTEATVVNDELLLLETLYQKMMSFKFMFATCKQGGEVNKFQINTIEPITSYFRHIPQLQNLTGDLCSFKEKL